MQNYPFSSFIHSFNKSLLKLCGRHGVRCWRGELAEDTASAPSVVQAELANQFHKHIFVVLNESHEETGAGCGGPQNEGWFTLEAMETASSRGVCHGNVRGPVRGSQAGVEERHVIKKRKTVKRSQTTSLGQFNKHWLCTHCVLSTVEGRIFREWKADRIKLTRVSKYNKRLEYRAQDRLTASLNVSRTMTEHDPFVSNCLPSSCKLSPDSLLPSMGHKESDTT